MYGYVTEGRGSIGAVTIRGVPFLKAELPAAGAFCRLRRRRLWRQLLKAGVRRCVMPQTLDAEAAHWGILPVEVLPLRLALLDDMLDLCPNVRYGTAALYAHYAEAGVYRAAEVLARRARYITLRVNEGGEALAQTLYCRYGLCTGGRGEAAVILDFTGTVKGAIRLDERGEIACEVDGKPMPERLAAVLFTAQVLQKGETRIKSLPINA